MRIDARGVRAYLVLCLLLILSAGFSDDQAGLPPPPPPPFVDTNLMAPPDTKGLPTQLQPTPPDKPSAWDQFAWQTFIAMNWPAIKPTAANGWLRGWPDASDPKNVNFQCAGVYNGALVWETFKEKREVFDQDALTPEAAKPKPWSYGFSYGMDGVTDAKLLTHGINFVPLLDGTKFVTLDETVEVASQALESSTKVPSPTSTPVFPRVYRGMVSDTSDPGNAIRYEVKVNYDFYKYVVDNELYYDENTYRRSLKDPPVQLPWRTSLSDPGVSFYTQKPATVNYVAGYSASQRQSQYQQTSQLIAKGPPYPWGKAAPPPPAIGAIHIKAAWVPIDKLDPKKQETFLRRKGTYFDAKGKPQPALFGLVGLHIIQRIKVGASGTPGNPTPVLNNQAIGGTFIYATWEHVEIEPPGDQTPQPYMYENLYFQNGVRSEGVLRPVLRLFKILGHTNKANDAVWAQIAGTRCGPQKKPPVWLNYRLVGVQFLPYDIPRPPATKLQTNYPVDLTPGQTDPGEPYGLPVYLANLFIETNAGLQHFQGLPPATMPTNQFVDTSPPTHSNPAGEFNHFVGNVRYGSNGNGVNQGLNGSNYYNMGGCMGCHGVAQLQGYSFSFVLLGGQAGAGVDAESRFAPPVNPNRPLITGGLVTIQNPAVGQYLANAGGRAVYQNSAVVFKIQGIDNMPTGARLKFGDPVYVIEMSSGQYLTATNTGGDVKQVSFSSAPSTAAQWILYNESIPGSTEDITNPSQLAFRNAGVTFPTGPGAYLTTYPGKGQVNTVNHASTEELWSLNRVR